MEKSLFKIQEQYLELMTSLMENEGELTEELQQALAVNQQDLEKKSEGYVGVIRKLEGESKIIDDEIKRLQGLKKTRQNAVNRLKDALSNAMQMYEIERIETPFYKLSFRKSESVEINCDIDDLPAELTVIERNVISKTEIKTKLKEGKIFAGVELKINKNLQIK